MNFSGEMKQSMSLQLALDNILDYLGDTYVNLSCANSALRTVTNDVHDCIRYVEKKQNETDQSEQQLEATTSQSCSTSGFNSKGEDEEVDEEDSKALPSEIESILAKARKVVKVESYKKSKKVSKRSTQKQNLPRSQKRVVAPSPQRFANLQGRVSSETNPSASFPIKSVPAQCERKNIPQMNLPSKLKSLKQQTLLELESFANKDKEAAYFATSTMFNKEILKVLHESVPLIPEKEAEDASQTCLTTMHKLREVENKVLQNNKSALSQTDAAILRSKVKDIVHERMKVKAQLEHLNQYGAKWMQIASKENENSYAEQACKDREEEAAHKALMSITEDGNLDALCLQWLPQMSMNFNQLSPQDEETLGQFWEKIVTNSCSRSKTTMHTKKHKYIVQARALIQQMLFQLHLEGKLIKPILPEKIQFDVESAITSINVEDAVALERLYARCYLAQVLSPEIGNPTPSFFFRQPSAS